jgi:hypothetical protein
MTPSKHVARVVIAIITEAIEQSFLLDEFDTSVIENVAAVPSKTENVIIIYS